jgi:hypothetical protein
MPYSITGDFAVVEAGDYLMLVRIQTETEEVSGALLQVHESLLRRTLAANAKWRTTR